MTRMIERWFPCEEVSGASHKGWGTGNKEATLFTWFAKRPLAQARAAALASLLPWPDEPAEQHLLQKAARSALLAEKPPQDVLDLIAAAYGRRPVVLDPFSGRGMIPLEAARLGARAFGLDYSPVATLAGKLLAEYVQKDWRDEPVLPFAEYVPNPLEERVLYDAEFIFDLIGRRLHDSMSDYYPTVDGVQPWGYLWAVSIPCGFCQRWFPLVGSLSLREPHPRSGISGSAFRLSADGDSVAVEVHDGVPVSSPTLVKRSGKRGRIAVCLFCDGAHDQATVRRIMKDGKKRDLLLLAADPDPDEGKRFRLPTERERQAAAEAKDALDHEQPFGLMPAVPDEPTPPGLPLLPSVYGYTVFGDLCCSRQTLSYVRLCRIINNLSDELRGGGISEEYARCLTGLVASVMVRKLRRSTRGAFLQVYNDGRPTGVMDIFTNESSIGFSFDFFEVGLGDGAGSWASVASRSLATLRYLVSNAHGSSVTIERGNAARLPFPDSSIDAVVTDPPYDAMIYYSDTSDLFFVWLKRALLNSHPDLVATAASDGLQEKEDEAIVREHKVLAEEHRTRDHYDRMMVEAFSEARRVVRPDGVVTIVFGHGEPEVWHRLLSAISSAGLVLTGSWPAQTEKGGKAGTSNIVTTLTLTCRPAAAGRVPGRVSEVDAAVLAEIRSRLALWDQAGLALTDQLMASAGPAMEVVGRYSEVLDKAGRSVELDRYLPLARRYVEEAADIRIDKLPLETFDARTRFALFWARLYGRAVAASSEARWHRLASDLQEDEVAGLLTRAGKGIRLAYSEEHEGFGSGPDSAIDVAMEVAVAGRTVAGVAEVLNREGRAEDEFLWAAMGELARRVPEADPDGEVWTWVVRNRSAITGAAQNIDVARAREEEAEEIAGRQGSLFGESQ